jgi:hypothetical protein
MMLARRLRRVKGAKALYGFLTIPPQACRHAILAVQFESTFAKPTVLEHRRLFSCRSRG